MMIIIIISGKNIILLQVSVDRATSPALMMGVWWLFTEKNTHNFNKQHGLDRPVKSIAIYLIYARANSGRRFITGVEGSSRRFSV